MTKKEPSVVSVYGIRETSDPMERWEEVLRLVKEERDELRERCEALEDLLTAQKKERRIRENEVFDLRARCDSLLAAMRMSNENAAEMNAQFAKLRAERDELLARCEALEGLLLSAWSVVKEFDRLCSKAIPDSSWYEDLQKSLDRLGRRVMDTIGEE